MDGYLPFHHVVSFPLWTTAIEASFIPANIYPDYFISALDDVHWSAVS
jgi:hypothetical protein